MVTRRVPKVPPSLGSLIEQFGITETLEAAEKVSALPQTEYLHWDTLRFLTPPEGLSRETWWLGTRFNRERAFKQIPLCDLDQRRFSFLVPDSVAEQLHRIDLSAGGRIGIPPNVINAETRDQYSMASLLEEAITSSQLEGAATTREVAKEMLRSSRPPRDRDERMILNNFHTMQHVRRVKDQPLTPALIFELHRMVTEQALEDPSAAGRCRRADEPIIVGDQEDGVFHIPPPSEELTERMQAMCDFANRQSPQYFLHPVLRSVLLHFWLAYDHPFVDGNGRTARALFYWSMLHYGFWLFEFLSISRVLRKAPIQYARSFLHTETDGNDLTYFVLYQMDVIRRSLDDLHAYIEAQSRKMQQMEQNLRGVRLLNYRQRALISHALRHPHESYTIEGHRLSHNVVYQTAYSDLFDLEERGLLEKAKIGRALHFCPIAHLEARLAALG